MNAIDEKRREWEREQAARVENTDDEILALANEIYEDGKATMLARRRGEFWKGALEGLGFEAWTYGWGGRASPDNPNAIARILHSLRHKPYYARLAAAGLRHPQRKVERRAERFDYYCEIDSRLGQINWGLRETRERDERFQALYGQIELRVLDHGEVVAKVVSESFDNGNSLTELRLDDDDYRFEVRVRDKVDGWRSSAAWFDYAEIDGEWRLLEMQGGDWDGEWEGSTRTHTGAERIHEPTAAERARALFAKERIERENRDYGPVADRTPRADVLERIEKADAAGDKRGGDFWRIVRRIQDDRAAAQAIEDDEAEESGVVEDPKAEVIEYFKGIRDNPPNPRVRGNPHHIHKFNRVLAALGENTGVEPWAPAEIRARAAKWPSSPWARAVPFLAG